MNPRVLNILLVIQALFIAALFYAGYCSRESRKVGYLELTHRVTSGQATEEEFDKLAGFLPDTADKQIIRSLFGLPVARAVAVGLSSKEILAGDLWIFYPRAEGAAPIDSADVATLSGSVPAFIFEFDLRGRARWRKGNIEYAQRPSITGTAK